MASELATAYISLIPSFKGAKGAIAGELGDALEAEGQQAADKAGQKAGRTFGDRFSGAAQGILGGAAAFGGAALLAEGFQQALDGANLPGRLEVQFGLAGPMAKQAAEAAGKLYSEGWGQSLAEVGQATGEVSRALAQVGSSEDIGRLTKQAQALSGMFGEELPRVINAAGKLVKSGLAPDFESALDVITAGYARIPESAEDALDTITEYSVQFKALGLDARTAFGLIAQGGEAAARNTDLIADTVKEFNAIVQGGSKESVAAFKALGINAKTAQADIAAGGPRAAAALDLVLDRLRDTKDPVERNAAAFGLFGTKFEDLQSALYALDPSAAVAALGDVDGAAQKMADTMGGGTQMQLAALGRQFGAVLAPALAAVLPHVSGVLDAIRPYVPALAPLVLVLGAVTAGVWLWNAGLGAVLTVLGRVVVLLARAVIGLVSFAARAAMAGAVLLGRVVTAMATMTAATVRWLAVQTMAAARMVAGWVLLGVQSLVQAARVAAAWLIAMGPVALIIAVVIGLVALIIANWDTIVTAISAAWEWVKQATAAAWEWIKGVVASAVDFITRWFMPFALVRLIWEHWETIKGFFAGAWQAITSGVRDALDWIGGRWSAFADLVSGVVGRVKSFLGSIWDGVKDGARAAANFAIRVINGMIGGANKAISGLNMVPGVSVGYIPYVPYLAKGGVTTGPTLAMIGEGAEQEAVLPLSKLDSMLAGRSAPVTVQVTGAGLDRALAEWLRKAVRVSGGGSVQTAFGR